MQTLMTEQRLTVSLVSQHLISSQSVGIVWWVEADGGVAAASQAAEQSKIKKDTNPDGHCLFEHCFKNQWGHNCSSEWNSFCPLALYCASLISKVRLASCYWWTRSHVTDARCLPSENAWTEEQSGADEESHLLHTLRNRLDQLDLFKTM